MNGPERATQAITDRLTADLPGRLARMETDLGLPAGALPVPQKIVPRDEWHLGVDDFPAVLIVAQDLVSLTPVDVGDEAGQRYRARYALRAYVWARGDHDADTDLARKRLTLAVRESLLALPSAGVDGLAVEPATIRESYSDVGVDEQTHATIAAAWIGFDAYQDELITDAAPVGSADALTVEVGLIPHPALVA
jgi:hypothetical protein